eukprot:1144598-Pelagomonas_calceolata.AAC.2
MRVDWCITQQNTKSLRQVEERNWKYKIWRRDYEMQWLSPPPDATTAPAVLGIMGKCCSRRGLFQGKEKQDEVELGAPVHSFSKLSLRR